ncbi:uncharacterized protein LOC134535499 isoform X2 [Bacillus rossius redtenbacheri]|uniref:uncharacterized protein LOC134535499 isoform X2 n=1 Tax=Bacillus rossius redtenbacheri TaxID=93214 RepID=UPI002FDDF819
MDHNNMIDCTINNNDTDIERQAVVLSTATRHWASFTPTAPMPSASRLRAAQPSRQLPLKMVISDVAQRSHAKSSPQESTSQQEDNKLIESLIEEPADFETIKRAYELSLPRPSKRICKKNHDQHLPDSSAFTSQLVGKQRFLLPWNTQESVGKGSSLSFDFDGEEFYHNPHDSSEADVSSELSTPLATEIFQNLYGNDLPIKPKAMQTREPQSKIFQTYLRNLPQARSLDKGHSIQPDRSNVNEEHCPPKCNGTQRNFTKTSEFVKPKFFKYCEEIVPGEDKNPQVANNYFSSSAATVSRKRKVDESQSLLNVGECSPDEPASSKTEIDQRTKNINVSFNSYYYNFLTLSSNINKEPQETLPAIPRDSKHDESFENLQEHVLDNL